MKIKQSKFTIMTFLKTIVVLCTFSTYIDGMISYTTTGSNKLDLDEKGLSVREEGQTGPMKRGR